MASSIKTIQTRINATRKTEQITKAMNMVSAAKLRGAEASIKNYIPFTQKIDRILDNLLTSSETIHPLLEEREVNKTCYIVITCERGLAGPFNNNLYKLLANEVKDSSSCVCPLGSRGFTYCLKKGYEMIIDTPYLLKDDVSFDDVYGAVEKALEAFIDKKVDRIVVLYNHHVNTLTQVPTLKQILPIEKSDIEGRDLTSYEYEGGIESILDTLVPLYIENIIFGYILDSKASEHAARMTAMKSATDNAGEVISKLQLLYNRARQSAITLELTDIISGASAINQN